MMYLEREPLTIKPVDKKMFKKARRSYFNLSVNGYANKLHYALLMQQSMKPVSKRRRRAINKQIYKRASKSVW